MEKFIDGKIIEVLVYAIVKIVIGFIGVCILSKIINVFVNKVERSLKGSKRFDDTVISFLKPLVSKGLKFFVFVLYVGFIGVETSAIVAAITSIGLAIGLAFQGALSNIAGGFIILIMRPFKVHDYIKVGDNEGTVESIQVFYTTLVTIDNKVIKLPNGEVSNVGIIDYTTKELRRVDMKFIIAHDDDLNVVREIMFMAIDGVKGCLKEPAAPFVGVSNVDVCGVEVVLRVWVKTEVYWRIYFELIEKIKREFKKNNIGVAYSSVRVKNIDGC